MRLYLVRHGAAVDEDVDPRRPLSAQGRLDVAQVGALMEGRGVAVNRIFHSGKARAAETAGILGAMQQPPGGVAEMQGIKPDDPVEPVAARVAAWGEDVMLVGHLPFLDRLVRSLLGPGGASPGFPTAGAIALERDSASSWRIIAHFAPDA